MSGTGTGHLKAIEIQLQHTTWNIFRTWTMGMLATLPCLCSCLCPCSGAVWRAVHKTIQHIYPCPSPGDSHCECIIKIERYQWKNYPLPMVSDFHDIDHIPHYVNCFQYLLMTVIFTNFITEVDTCTRTRIWWKVHATFTHIHACVVIRIHKCTK